MSRLAGPAGHRTPPGEAAVRPPRASLGRSPLRAHVWRCCGMDWRGAPAYDRHLAVSHGGDRRGPNAPGGSGQGVEPRRGELPL